ncbi:hypothetical protein BC835DRAFT_1290385, partial [Cytidiella melzeri]
IYISPDCLIALVLFLLSTFLRLHCFACLGRTFTFELCLREKHELIQSGPYSVVRHPAYTGNFGLIFGNAVINFGRGGWWWAYLTSPGSLGSGGALAVAVLGVLNLLFLIPLPYILVKRCIAEDAVLRGHFSEEWDSWEERVPYRLVPGVW